MSKRDAKRRAREQEPPCIPGIPLERGETLIGPPDIDAQVENGQLVEFSIKNLSGIEHLFTTTDIDQNAALWIFGMNCFDPDLSEDWELVKALLKVWGLYIGGSTETEIKSQHNLCDDDITLLAHRNWNCIEFICDQAGVYHWNFVDSPDDLLDNED